ncbi:MAG: sulfatase [Bryobacteraceae bacterium]
MKRRTFLQGGLAAPAALRGAGSRPNILFAIADDWGWPHARVYGDTVIRTPTFDRVCEQGVVFTQAYCAAPSCTPSRAAILTGRAPHRLEEGGNLWSFLPSKFPVYPDLLEKTGYFVGFERKGWGPGTLEGSGRTRNPAGNAFKDFNHFLSSAPQDKPFCYWFGSHDPHRPYEKGSGAASGLNPKGVRVPAFLPDVPEVRGDFLDCFFEAQRFDRETGEILRQIERAGRLENTIVIMTGDNGCSFPRSKANVYNWGSHQPFAMMWKAGMKGGRTVDEFITLADMAPTFLEAAGLKPLAAMTGRSILGLATGASREKRDAVFVERERHANCRAGNLGYPMRAARTREYLYIRNLRPDRWPAGDPGRFGDVDPGPSKDYVLQHRNEPYFPLAFEKRPAEELYDLKKDPFEIRNVAGDSAYAGARRDMRARLDLWMRETADPRASSDADPWDSYPYVGGGGGGRKK